MKNKYYLILVLNILVFSSCTTNNINRKYARYLYGIHQAEFNYNISNDIKKIDCGPLANYRFVIEVISSSIEGYNKGDRVLINTNSDLGDIQLYGLQKFTAFILFPPDYPRAGVIEIMVTPLE